MNELHDGWPRLPSDLLIGLSETERATIRQHEEETIAGNKMQLADICENCHIKPQFAKTYRVLRRDLREMLAQLRAKLNLPASDSSDGYGIALLRSTDEIISHKLRLMAQHFHIRWGEPIENWAGKEGSAIDKSGCVILLAGIGSILSVLCILIITLCV